MGRKKKITALRHHVAHNVEGLIVQELGKLKAPLWRRILGFFNVEIVRSWYKRKELEVEANLTRAGKNVYRSLK